MRLSRPAMRLSRILPLCLIGAVAVAAFGFKAGDTPGGQMKTFADAFLETLDEGQRETATVPYDSPKRVDWHFIPMDSRKGLPIKEMNTSQRTGALRLVRAALSEVGYDKTSKIMELETVLKKLEGDNRNWPRDSELYYVTLFGTPSDSDPWGLSFEGHHLSLNFVCRDGKVVDSTPQFMGANPAIIQDELEGPLGKGTRVLRDEEVLAFDLVNSLTESQAEAAVIADEAPSEIRFAGEPQADVDDPQGIPYDRFNGDQKELLKKLVFTYTDNVAGPVAEVRRELIDGAGWDSIRFAWAGPKKPGIGHYYRIRGEGFLIEFVNTQPDASGNPANHIHAVFRDLTGDFNLAPAQ